MFRGFPGRGYVRVCARSFAAVCVITAEILLGILFSRQYAVSSFVRSPQLGIPGTNHRCVSAVLCVTLLAAGRRSAARRGLWCAWGRNAGREKECECSQPDLPL